MNKYRFPSVIILRRIPNYRSESVVKPSTEIANQTIETLSHGTYGGLLFHPHWKEKRVEILARDHGRCVICGEANDLQVHHRQYHFIKKQQCFKVPWDYDNGLLITLCKSCHNRGHSKYKVPTLVI